MFFLLRCMFWLSIVYASILNSDDWRHMSPETARVGKDTIGRVEQTVLTTATHYCTTRAADCLSASARLTALIDAGSADATASDASRADATTPAPVPRPHDIDGGRLTRRP